MLYHHKRFEKSYSEVSTNTATSSRQHDSAFGVLEKRWGKLLSLVSIIDGNLIVYGTAESRENVAVEIAKAIVYVLLRGIPGKPEIGKWTKDGPALDWYVALSALGSLLQTIVGDAWRHMRVEVREGVKVQELSFHELQGLRIKGARELVAAPEACFNLKVITLCMNGTRYLTDFFLKTSRELHDPCKPCCSMDWLNPRTSHATVATQYIGSLVAGTSPHLQLLWGTSECQSWLDFVRRNPAKVLFASSAFYVVSASMHRRAIAPRSQGINPLITLADERVDLEERRNVADVLASRRKLCCRGRFVYNFMHQFITCAGDFFSQTAQTIMKGIAWAIKYVLSVADAERRHLRSKRFITRTNMEFYNFFAKSFVAEWRSIVVRGAEQASKVNHSLLHQHVC